MVRYFDYRRSEERRDVPSDLRYVMFGVAASGGTLHVRHMIISKDIVTDAARSAVHFSNILRW